MVTKFKITMMSFFPPKCCLSTSMFSAQQLGNGTTLDVYQHSNVLKQKHGTYTKWNFTEP